MPDTQFLEISYPNENDDPYYDEIVATFAGFDSAIYGLIATNQPLLGGGTVSLATQSISPPTAILSWTAPFEIIIPGSGVFMKIPYGPDQQNPSIALVDGDRVIVVVPLTSTGAMTGYLAKINGALKYSTVQLQGLYTVGIYRGGTFYHNLPRTLP